MSSTKGKKGKTTKQRRANAANKNTAAAGKRAADKKHSSSLKYTVSTAGGKNKNAAPPEKSDKNNDNKDKKFPSKFPFWARLKIDKSRTTLVIDEDKAYNKQKKKFEDGFVHREATSQMHKDYEKIEPNPDKSKSEPMYLKRPRKTPKRLFEPHNKELDMPKNLKERYEKNNKKKS